MDFEFDKEIDALLRQTAQDETAFAAENPKSKIQNPKSLHLGADEISAFAENALPEKTRAAYTTHLADCDRCRKILSNVISLNAESESETVHAEEKEIIPAPIPWYRKLFVFPNLAYTLGALVLVFSGIAVLTVLQNSNNLQNAEISQVSERQPTGKGMSSDGDATPVESYSNSMMSSNTMMSNSASMNSSSTSAANFSAVPSAPVMTANSNASGRRESDKDLKAEPKATAPQKEPADSAKTDVPVITVAPPSPKENNYSAENEAQKQQPAQNSMAQNQTIIVPDSRDVQSLPKLTRRAESKNKKLEESKNDAQEKSIETTTVGGKTFKRTNNAWYDSAYKGQPTINITRGTKEYKKLDSDLRGIVENLGGTVVLVWKEKAYRIQ
ncbi:MAG TPA: zf-HC2 domain-containing protein [Pyrinomonadaceae bacterium]|nr:zf-HC2 domain-containing protein [Pyrinomonadaceae bacterium]